MKKVFTILFLSIIALPVFAQNASVKWYTIEEAEKFIARAARNEAREHESQITDDLIDRIAAHPEDYDVAANRDPNARLEAETPDD